MFHALSAIFCFVTSTVSFLYGTRISWVCGKKCQFHEDPEERKHLLRDSLPAAIAVYFFGFVLVFSQLMDGFLTILIVSLTSAVLLSSFVISMSMPELRRKSQT